MKGESYMPKFITTVIQRKGYLYLILPPSTISSLFFLWYDVPGRGHIHFNLDLALLSFRKSPYDTNQYIMNYNIWIITFGGVTECALTPSCASISAQMVSWKKWVYKYHLQKRHLHMHEWITKVHCSRITYKAINRAISFASCITLTVGKLKKMRQHPLY